MAGKGFTVKKGWDEPREHAMPAEARVPAEMRLGAVVVAPATVLAPMAGVTDSMNPTLAARTKTPRGWGTRRLRA